MSYNQSSSYVSQSKGGYGLQKAATAQPMIVQSYEHYAIGHPDLKNAAYKHIDLDQRDLRQNARSQLCNMNFLIGHECIFGPYCLFAHSVADVEEKIHDVSDQKKSAPHLSRRLFKDLGIWPSICILQFFSQEEIIETLRRVNRQSLALCKRAYAPKRVQLHRITLGTVKFFERTEEIRVTKDSLSFKYILKLYPHLLYLRSIEKSMSVCSFFTVYRENFFREILQHYKNVRRLTINLNFLFEEDKKDRFIEMICNIHQQQPPKQSIQIFAIEDAPLREKNLDQLFKSNILQNIQTLKLPRNNLMNKGIEILFKNSGDRLKHIKKLDISSNLISGEEGGAIIAQSKSFPNLYSLDLRLNKLGDEGFKILVKTTNYPMLTDLKIDKNRKVE